MLLRASVPQLTVGNKQTRASVQQEQDIDMLFRASVQLRIIGPTSKQEQAYNRSRTDQASAASLSQPASHSPPPPTGVEGQLVKYFSKQIL